jgi:urease accessory protein
MLEDVGVKWELPFQNHHLPHDLTSHLQTHDASMTTPSEQQALREEIAALEGQLHNARSRLNNISIVPNGSIQPALSASPASSLHTLLLLSDSALPLGSFAFSSGLESYLAHHPRTSSQTAHALFQTFLALSLRSLASTALPYVLASFRDPQRLEELDNDFDASTPCTVARRASVAQGRALMGVWERSFRAHYTEREDDEGIAALESFAAKIRAPEADNAYPPNGHLAPLWGITMRILGLPLQEAAYLFLFSHARTVVSAGVRASVLGPYQAQSVLASKELRSRIEELIVRYGEMQPEDAGQSVPVVDLWVGRHEMLYSRIFNS